MMILYGGGQAAKSPAPDTSEQERKDAEEAARRARSEAEARKGKGAALITGEAAVQNLGAVRRLLGGTA